MRKGGAKQKGNSFERQVAKLILGRFKKCGYKFTDKDLFRTPGSGGHIFASQLHPGDLQPSPALAALFPFTSECKFYKTIELGHFFSTQRKKSWKEFQWLDQAINQTLSGTYPLLIFKANRGLIWCVIPSVSYKVLNSSTINGFLFTYDNRNYVLGLFEDFLNAAIRKRGKSK